MCIYICRLSDETVHELVSDAVNHEKEFVCEALSVDLIGMNSRMMSDYIEFVADRLLISLNVPKLYNTANPFDWMELISLQVVSIRTLEPLSKNRLPI